MNSKLLNSGTKTRSAHRLIMTALKVQKKMHSVFYVWLYKAACVCSAVGGGPGTWTEPACLGNRQKGPLKRLIRPRQVTYIKT